MRRTFDDAERIFRAITTGAVFMDLGITVYGVDQCEDTQRTMHHLKHLGLQFRYINLEHDAEADRQVKEWNSGKRITPTVVIALAGYRRTIAEPENAELDLELDRANLLPGSQDRRAG